LLKILKQISFILCVVILAVIFIAGRFINRDSGYKDYRLTQVVKRSFDIEVKTIGHLDAERSHMVSSGIRGDEGKIIYLINDGAHVKKGDVLVKLDSTPFDEKVQRLEEDADAFSSAVEAKKQLFEWAKNKAGRDIKTAEFNLTIARLDLRKLVEGDAPHEIAQLTETVESALENLNKYALYIESLKKLRKNGYDYPSEINLAQKKIKELEGK